MIIWNDWETVLGRCRVSGLSFFPLAYHIISYLYVLY